MGYPAIVSYLATLIVFASSVAAQETERLTRDDLVQLGFGFIIPKPISQQEVDRYRVLLNLSDAQEGRLQQMLLAYIDRVLREDSTWVQRLQQEFGGFGPTRAERLRAVLNIRKIEEQMFDAYEHLDDQFFKGFEDFLAETQLPALERVRMHRQRARCEKSFFIRKAIALSELVQELDMTIRCITPEVDEKLWAYERAVTPLFVEADRRRRSAQKDLVQLDLEEELLLRSLKDPKQQEVIALITPFRERALQIRKRILSQQHRIVHVNEEYRTIFMRVMNLSHAAQFNAHYLSELYRRVYPDATDPEPLFQAIRAVIQDEERALAMDVIWNQYRSRYEQLCTMMRDKTDTWQEQWALTHDSKGWPEHNRQMDEWYLARVRKNREVIERLESLLPADLAPRYADALAQARRKCDETEEQRIKNPTRHASMD